jgi:hypothetical protein
MSRIDFGDIAILQSHVTVTEETAGYLCFGFFPSLGQARQDCEFLSDWYDPAFYARQYSSAQEDFLTAAQSITNFLVSTSRKNSIGSGVTAGLDSRLLLYLADSVDLSLNLYSFGTEGMIDFDFVKVLAKQTALSVNELNTRQMTLDLESLHWGASFLNDFIPSPRLLMMKEILKNQDLEIHGYLNDFLTGAHFFYADTWDGARQEFIRKNDSFGFQKYFSRQVGSLLPENQLLDRKFIPFFDQLELLFRQKQRIRLQSQETKTLFPFEEKEWIGFWLSREWDERSGQSLYLSMLRNLDTNIFFDVNMSGARTRAALKTWQKHFLYGKNGEPGELSESYLAGIPLFSGDSHFCAMACFHQNALFQRTCLDLIDTLRQRNFFTTAFIDTVLNDVRARKKTSNKALKGLLSTELAFASGKLVAS